jgi:hypothetical protein
VYEHEKLARFKSILMIERCRPPDAPAPINARIGQELLAEAQRGFENWRLQSTVVLVRLDRLNPAAARKVPPLRRTGTAPSTRPTSLRCEPVS